MSSKAEFGHRLTFWKVYMNADDEEDAEDKMRGACIEFGSLAGMCQSPMTGKQAKSMPEDSYSHGEYYSC